MTTRSGVAEPRPTLVDDIEAEAAALLAEAGLPAVAEPAARKPRKKSAEASTEPASAPAPKKSRTKAVSLQEIGAAGEAESPAPARKRRQTAKPVETDDNAGASEEVAGATIPPTEADAVLETNATGVVAADAPARKRRPTAKPVETGFNAGTNFEGAAAANPLETHVVQEPLATEELSTEAPVRKRRETAKPVETGANTGIAAKQAEVSESRKTTNEPAGGELPHTEAFGPTFAELGLNEAILKSVKDVGYEAPSPIQVITIPAMLRGVDIIAQAQTGSGKTAAFGLPIIEQMDSRDRHVQALILTPTRELAIQVAEALHKYGKHKHIETLPIYGGQPYERQFRGLQRGPQIVVGTPGRVMDHMRRGTLNLDHIRFFVLDEADEMLDMGFIEDIEWVLEHTPAERQTALFSATMPPRIVDLSRRYLNEPERLTVQGKEMTVPATRQTYYEVPRARKIDALTRILDAETPPLTLIFCRTKHGVDELGEALMARGFGAETLHGDLSQAQRDRVMKRFRAGQADILVATDVAARGIDVPEISHVFNFDIPESPEAYVHRIGRTGRAGRAGEAVTLVTPKEVRWLKQIERVIKAQIEQRRLPTAADVADRRREALRMQIVEVLETEEGYTAYLDTIGNLAEEHDVAEIAAALLKLYADETGRGISSDQKEDDLAILTAATSGRGEQRMVRLFLNIGRNFGVRPQDIVGAIANEAGISGRAIGAIDILDTYSFVDIPNQFADQVIDALRRSGIKGRPVNAERAQGEAPRTGNQGDRRGPRQDFDRGGNRPAGPRRDGPGNRQGGYPRDQRGPAGQSSSRPPRGNRRSDW